MVPGIFLERRTGSAEIQALQPRGRVEDVASSFQPRVAQRILEAGSEALAKLRHLRRPKAAKAGAKASSQQKPRPRPSSS